MSSPVVWTQPGGCSTCRFCGMDMEMEPYCAHPDVLVKWKHGLVINRAIEDYCGPNLKLRQEKRR